MTIATILVLLALICFVIAAVGRISTPINLTAAGLALMTVVVLMGQFLIV